MKSKVYFTPARGTPKKNKFKRLRQLVRAASIGDCFTQGELVALKVHWGELGNADFVPSFFIRQLVDEIRTTGASPFLTETNTLYRGSRHNAVENLATAEANGFTNATVGCPLVVADGLRGTDYGLIPVQGRFVEDARIASSIIEADGLMVASHVKGHMLFGFGGAIKNLGMGCSAAAAKQFLHADIRPKVNQAACTGCQACVKHCRFNAISMVRQDEHLQASIDSDVCTGCGECLVVCPEEAIPIDWGDNYESVQRKTAEYALAAVRGKERKMLFVNFLTSITPDCDCCSWSDAPIVPDIGYLASRDPVAIDQASVDLVNNFTGFADRESVPVAKDRWRIVHDVAHEPTLEHAEEVGLGSRKYELVEL